MLAALLILNSQVMVHMDMIRAKTETAKREEMVRGLGSFIEGKSSIEDWWMGNDKQKTSQSADASPPNTRISNQWADSQYSRHHVEAIGKSDAAKKKSSEYDRSTILEIQSQIDMRGSQDSSGEPVKPINEDPKAKETSRQDSLSRSLCDVCLPLRDGFLLFGRSLSSWSMRPPKV